jgi:hypothetical protein
MRTAHYYSGILLASFIGLHFANHLFAIGGPEIHIQVMDFFRQIYRFPPVEILLILCVAFQIISGARLLVRPEFYKGGIYNILQALSGLYLGFFLTIHVIAVLTGRFVHHIDTNFYFAAGVANSYPSKLFFIPYYTLSLICVFTHIACVHRNKVISLVSPSKAQRQFFVIMGVGVFYTLLVICSISGVFYKIN